MESQALLTKPTNRYLPQDLNSSEDEDWSDSCSSSYSESGSSVAEWENLVDEMGELLYIDCHPQVVQQQKDEPNQTQNQSESQKNNENFNRTNTRRSKRGKLSRLIRRRDQKRQSTRSYTTYTDAYAPSELQTQTQNQNSKVTVTFHDNQEGEVREVLLDVDPKNRAKYGRRATIVEALLGLNITTFSDGNRIMIAGFVPNGNSVKVKNIKIGDWLKCLNGIEVNYGNINSFLEDLEERQEVSLTLQRIGAIEITKNPPINELTNQSSFVRQLTNPCKNEDDILCDVLSSFPVGVVYLKTENLSETGPEFDDIIYAYPKPFERNILCTSRGIFTTLNHLLPQITKNKKPNLTSCIANGLVTHITYISSNDKLLLLAFPNIRSNSFESLKSTSEVFRCLSFCYKTLDHCFGNGNLCLDRFFSRFFARLLTSGTWYNAPQQIELEDINIQVIGKGNERQGQGQFENLLGGAQFISLPREAQMQLDDALNELEACDYRDWNEDPLNCQRIFSIIGSAFYHNGYLLASHLQWEDLVDIHCFCRQQGILHLSCTEPIRTLVLWREVFPSSYNQSSQDENSIYKTPKGRWFLLIVGNSKDLLAVLMEIGGCTSPSEENQGPDVFYVEEAQETLQHIQSMGISALAEKWISLNARPQITTPDPNLNRQNKKIDFLGNIGFIKSNSPTSQKEISPKKTTEVTSILKQKTSSKSNINLSGSNSVFSDVSEDSASQDTRSEVSDEPVVGRRATREKNLDSDDSDSDWDTYRPNSEISGSFETNDLKQLSDTIPSKLTSGEENILYHYVHFDSTEGILMCPPFQENTNNLYDKILRNFRKSCQKIHEVFGNTVRFNTMLAHDIKSVVNKSLIAVKEHGVLFELPIEENGKKVNSITYWVVGRLFYDPHPRELYICYQDNVPQNLVEIAFRLGVNAAG